VWFSARCKGRCSHHCAAFRCTKLEPGSTPGGLMADSGAMASSAATPWLDRSGSPKPADFVDQPGRHKGRTPPCAASTRRRVIDTFSGKARCSTADSSRHALAPPQCALMATRHQHAQRRRPSSGGAATSTAPLEGHSPKGRLARECTAGGGGGANDVIRTPAPGSARPCGKPAVRSGSSQARCRSRTRMEFSHGRANGCTRAFADSPVIATGL